MKFIEDTEDGFDLEKYLQYLESMRGRLPPNTKHFVFHEDHYNFTSEKCLHDSWVQHLTLEERPLGTHGSDRVVNINLKLLGAFHDGYHHLTYHNVESYSLRLRKTARSATIIGHGDWLIDEVTLNENGMVCHEIIFSDTGTWKIVCADISYRWSAGQPDQ